MSKFESELILRDILEWVLANRRDVPAMDKVNKATYPYTSHYMNKVLDPREEEDERLDTSS